MHTAELLEEALQTAQGLGFKIRHVWLDGNGGGGCEINGQRWIFIDLALGPADQLAQVIGAMELLPEIATLPLRPELRNRINLRKSA